jgi:hypothetical protein
MSRRGSVAVVLGAMLVLSGCGSIADAVVGIEPAPAERPASAPLDPAGGVAIATRLLAAAEDAGSSPGAAGLRARSEVFAGDALAVANARAARAVSARPEQRLAPAPPPTVVAQSRGRQWPRAILASTLDESTNTRYLHVLVSDAPERPFRIRASVAMFPGSTLPSLGAPGAGAPLVAAQDGTGLARSPSQALAGYAAALASPRPRGSGDVATDDPFATGLATSAATQVAALGTLGAYTQKHGALPAKSVSFRLAGGGAVVFALMSRTDTFTARPTAKALTLPRDLAALVGRASVTRSATATSLEPVVLLVPASGRTRAIGASELLVSGTGR